MLISTITTLQGWARHWATQILLLSLALAMPAATARAATISTTSGLTLRLLGPAIANQVRTRDELNFDVEYLARDERGITDIIARADAARSIINRETGDALLVRVRVIVAPDKDIFLKLVGGWAEHSAAVAEPRSRSMVLNGDAMRMGWDDQFPTTLIHEMAHLYLGARVTRRPVPRWLDEGIAQALSHEGSAEDQATLVMGKWLGRLIPLRDLETAFPLEGNRQRLAYRQSLSLARFLAEERGAGSMARFVQSLAGAEGSKYVDQLWEPAYRDELEARWKAGIGGRGDWLTLFLSNGIFWGACAALTVAAWVAIRWRRRAHKREEDEEERLYAALDEEEERAYGKFDPDDDDLVYRDEFEKSEYDDRDWKH